MSKETSLTKIEGFPYQHENVAGKLNDIYEKANPRTGVIHKATEHMPGFKICNYIGKVDETYSWAAEVEFILDKGAIKNHENKRIVLILFPVINHVGTEDAEMDRSISVYSNTEVAREDIKKLLSDIADNIKLKLNK